MFTEAERDLILNLHNDLRNRVAAGEVLGYNDVLLPSASKMAKMQWDPLLTSLAELNTRTCEMKHDCRSTREFIFAGQNIFKFTTTAPEINVTDVIQRSVRKWAEERQYTRVSDIHNITTIYQRDDESGKKKLFFNFIKY